MKTLSKLIFIGLIFSLSSCSSTRNKSDTGSNQEVKVIQHKEVNSDFKMRAYTEITLTNGLNLLFIPDRSLPRISLNLLIKTGTRMDPSGKEGLNALVASLIEKGSKTHSATEIADIFGNLGSDFSVSVDEDYTYFSASAIAPLRNELSNIFSEVLINPAFSEKEIQRLKSQFYSSIQARVDHPGHFTDTVFAEYVYGNHPYGRPASGYKKTISTISLRDLVRHYSRYYRPNNSILAIIGDFDESYIKEIRKQYEAWQPRKVEVIEFEKTEKPNGSTIRLIYKPGLTQTQIRIGHRGINRSHPDYFRLKIASLVLGGDFVSRLNKKIRIEKGLTYSIQSYFDTKMDNGIFAITTFTRNDKILETIREIRSTLDNFCEQGITSEELDSAKALMKGQFPQAIETADKLAFNLMLLRLYGISDNYLTHYLENVDNLSLLEVNTAIKKSIIPKELKTLIYTEKKAGEEQLKDMGLTDSIPYNKFIQ